MLYLQDWDEFVPDTSALGTAPKWYYLLRTYIMPATSSLSWTDFETNILKKQKTVYFCPGNPKAKYLTEYVKCFHGVTGGMKNTIIVCLQTFSSKFARIERRWKDGDTVQLHFPMEVTVEKRFNNSAMISRGPLVYSLKIGEQWEKIRGKEPCPNYAVYPTTPWNYGLLINDKNPKTVVIKKGFIKCNIGSKHAPLELKVPGRIIPEWKQMDNQIGPLPIKPFISDHTCSKKLTLIPYVCAKLRISEFPVLKNRLGKP